MQGSVISDVYFFGRIVSTIVDTSENSLVSDIIDNVGCIPVLSTFFTFIVCMFFVLFYEVVEAHVA